MTPTRKNQPMTPEDYRIAAENTRLAQAALAKGPEALEDFMDRLYPGTKRPVATPSSASSTGSGEKPNPANPTLPPITAA
jgi:hypothetical protein